MLLHTSYQIKHSQHLTKTLIPWHKPFLSSIATSSSFFRDTQFSPRKMKNKRNGQRVGSNIVKAISTSPETTTRVKAIVTVKVSVGGFLSNIGVTRGLNDITDLLGKSILLELVSAELDPNTGLERPTIKRYAHKQGRKVDTVKYECDFDIPDDFGPIGAVLVENEHQNEMFISNISFDGGPYGTVNVWCESWVHSKSKSKYKRIFFANKSYLPSQTPSGLTRLREEDLEEVRGTGGGQREKGDRIYDYDVYNDLGNPDSDPEMKRPVLGGKDFPYPRRCRTGRPRSKKDPSSEKRSSSYVYVPRDEEFSEVKNTSFSAKTVYSVLHAVVPSLETAILDKELGFPLFSNIDALFNEGVHIPDLKEKNIRNLFPRLVKAVSDLTGNVMQFETPALFERDKFSWFRDEEFSRQTLAGLNPCSIQLVTEWPLRSKLDPEIYGPPESVITKELVEKEIKGFMTAEEVVLQRYTHGMNDTYNRS